MKRIAPILPAVIASSALALVGVTSQCIVCISPFRPQRPANVTPFNVASCITRATATCSMCPTDEIARLCGTPVMPSDIPWYLWPFI